MNVEITTFLSETGDSNAKYVVAQKSDDGYIVKSTMTETLEQAQQIKKEWDKQLIVI